MSGISLPPIGAILLPFVAQPVLLFGLKYGIGYGLGVILVALLLLAIFGGEELSCFMAYLPSWRECSWRWSGGCEDRVSCCRRGHGDVHLGARRRPATFSALGRRWPEIFARIDPTVRGSAANAGTNRSLQGEPGTGKRKNATVDRDDFTTPPGVAVSELCDYRLDQSSFAAAPFSRTAQRMVRDRKFARLESAGTAGLGVDRMRL